MPREDSDKGVKAIESAKKLGAIGAKTLTKFVLRTGADELIDAVTDSAIDKLEDFEALDDVIKEIGDGMSKAAGQIIAAQMAAEKVRKKELPEQLATLHTALIQSTTNERVIILIDELDRCHPDYAIAVLEALKLVFNQSGFVFCLMVNADYLENLAQHRFGTSTNDEKYLDKFVDIRLKLGPKKEFFKIAILELVLQLPLAIPFGEDEAFSLEHAAALACELAVQLNLSMRKVKRILLKVEIALRCYAHRPLDASLLVFLACEDEVGTKLGFGLLPRSFLTPEEGLKQLQRVTTQTDRNFDSRDELRHELDKLIQDRAPELLELERGIYQYPDNQDYYDWVKGFKFLAPYYIPEHRDVLNAVSAVTAP